MLWLHNVFAAFIILLGKHRTECYTHLLDIHISINPLLSFFQIPSFDAPQTGLPDESLSKLLSGYPQITPAVHAKLTREVGQVILF